MEELKQFEDLCKYDNNFKVNNDQEYNFYKNNPEDIDISISNEKKYYNMIKEINLDENVSGQIKVGFTNALHLLIYSMYYRNFDTIAKEHALIVLEAALKDVYYKIKPYCKDCKKTTLNPLLNFFIKEKKIINIENIDDLNNQTSLQQQKNNEKEIQESLKKDISIPDGIENIQNDKEKFILGKTIIDNIKKLNNDEKIQLILSERNQLAHNSKPNNVDGVKWVKICAELINQLYKNDIK